MINFPKPLDVCISIISLDGNISKIKDTLFYHQEFFEKFDKQIISNKKTNYDNRFKEIVVESQEKFVLFDKAITESTKEWCFLILSGLHMQKFLIRKFSEFVKSEKDVLFPIKNRLWDFLRNPIECLLINKKFYKEVGFFGKENPEDIIKLLWAADVVKLGGTFKCIIGVKF